MSVDDILGLIGNKCDGFIGQVNVTVSSSSMIWVIIYIILLELDQLTEDWGEVLFSALRKAGGTAFSNMAVGYNNVDVDAATKCGISVGNTPVKKFPKMFFHCKSLK